VASDRKGPERRNRAGNGSRGPIYERNRIDESRVPSPERRARETAALSLPLVVADIRDQVSEVKKPWHASANEHTNAVTKYLKGETVEGWERREDVISRIAQLKSDFGSSKSLVFVSHGLLLTTWLDHEIGLSDPLSFWTDLRMPDAWVADFEDKSLERIVAR
jgi:broad specificity phosphatase PhoE